MFFMRIFSILASSFFRLLRCLLSHSSFGWHAKRFIATYYDTFRSVSFFFGANVKHVAAKRQHLKSSMLKFWRSRSMSTFVILSRKLFCSAVRLGEKAAGKAATLYLIHCEWPKHWTIAVFIVCVSEIFSPYFVTFYHLFNQAFDERDKKWCASVFFLVLTI